MNSNVTKYKTRTDLLTLVPEQSTFLEIGVFKGEFAKQILSIAKPKDLYLVDIWSGHMGSGDKDGQNYVEISDMEEIYLNLYKQTTDKPNVHVIRSKSVSFLKSCDDNFFDVVYVDGDHTAEAVYNDLVNSFSKLRNGGLLMGHDYHYTVGGDVFYAVTKFCNEYNQTIECIADDGCPSFLIRIKK